MLERFRKDSRAVVLDAMKEARVRADARIEAEHLLLALARRSAWDAGRVLAEAGIDHDGLRAALDDEVGHTLEAVGVGSGATWIPTRRCRSRVNRVGRVGEDGVAACDDRRQGSRRSSAHPDAHLDRGPPRPRGHRAAGARGGRRRSRRARGTRRGGALLAEESPGDHEVCGPLGRIHRRRGRQGAVCGRRAVAGSSRGDRSPLPTSAAARLESTGSSTSDADRSPVPQRRVQDAPRRAGRARGRSADARGRRRRTSSDGP